MSGFTNRHFRYFIPLAFLGAFFLLIAVLPNRGFSFGPSLAQAQTCGGYRQVGGDPYTVQVKTPKWCTREVNCRQHDVCDARNKAGKCTKSHTVRTCNSQTYQCGTKTETQTRYTDVRQVPNPPCPLPTCQNECTTREQWQCSGKDQLGRDTRQVCQLDSATNCYKWTQSQPCGGDTQCVAGTPGLCQTKPGGGIPGVIVSDRWFTLTAGYLNPGQSYIGESGNKYLTVGENTRFALRWDAYWPGAISFYKPTGCVKRGPQMNGGWQGSAEVNGGQSRPLSFSGQSNIGRLQTFQIECNGVAASNLVTVRYERESAQPAVTCASNECSPNRCWNSGQTRPCVKDEKTGNYCWRDPILSCTPGTHCGEGQCVNDATGQPQPPPDTTTLPDTAIPLPPGSTCRPGIDAACTPPGDCTPGTTNCPIQLPPTCTIGVDCPSSCTPGLDCPSTIPPGGGGSDGGSGGAGFPPYKSTQCYNGDDDDRDLKMDRADPGCKDSSGAYNPWDNSEFDFKIKEIIPDFFNLNWFKINVANFFKAEALAK